MQHMTFTVRFVTPAFLGCADQSAQWRTPPFKALIRQWWRVVHAPKVKFNVDALRRDEGALFGVAADGGDSRRSLVRFRLSEWQPGQLTQWQGGRQDVFHSEVGNGGRNVGSDLYLGYGPLTYEQGAGTVFAKVKGEGYRRTAIGDGQGQTLTIMVPEAHAEEIGQAVRLAAWFGTLGSRSRNGWGALQIAAEPGTPAIPELAAATLNGYVRSLAECLILDWPHAIGRDDQGPLVWRTAQKDTWREVMKELARIKIAFRTQSALSLGNVPNGTFAKRHLLAYPVTHHNVNGPGWGSQGRLANQMRFKVAELGNQWQGVIVHLPYRLPKEMEAALPPNQRNNIDATARTVWQDVHAVLDQNAGRID